MITNPASFFMSPPSSLARCWTYKTGVKNRLACFSFQPRLHVDAVDPEIDVALGREVAIAPARVFVRPRVLEPRDGRGRQPAGILAQQGRQRLLEVARRDALEVEDRDQDLEAPGAARVGRQNGGCKTDAILSCAGPVAHPRGTYRHRADAGHDRAFGQAAMAHQPQSAVGSLLVAMLAEKGGDLGLDCLDQECPRAIAQHLGQRIGKSAWLGQLENVSVDHGVSLLQWRSGGSNTPTIRRLTPSCRHQLPRIALGVATEHITPECRFGSPPS